jgi:predicted nucleic acid-binding protein
MTIVVSDTSPLNYLVQIKCEHLLPAIYKRVLIPGAVLRELENVGAPVIVRTWLGEFPDWIAVREVEFRTDPQLDELDAGERHAIQLASDENADLLLMDERAGVSLARERGLIVTGTLGVLLQGAERGLLDLYNALQDLQATAFRCTPGLIDEVKRRAGAYPSQPAR